MGAMSSNVGQMLRSNIQVLETIEPHVPELALPVVRRRLADFLIDWARNCGRRGAFGYAAAAVAKALSLDVVAVLKSPQTELARRRGWQARAQAPKSLSFLAWPISEVSGLWSEPSGRLETLCGRLDLHAPRGRTSEGLGPETEEQRWRHKEASQ